MVEYIDKTIEKKEWDRRERLIRVLALAVFSIMFQIYMVAPLIPQLSIAFTASEEVIGWIVPAYLIPYGISTLVYGSLSARLGRERVMLGSLLAFTVFTCLTATAQSFPQMLIWRVLTGISTSGVIPMALSSVGDLFPYEQRGRPLGWLFGAVAGGSAFGSTLGVMVEPLIGWRGLFLGVSILSVGVLFLLTRSFHTKQRRSAVKTVSINDDTLLVTYLKLINSHRGGRTYAYIFLNAIFQSGVFTWLGSYFARHYNLDAVGIGLVLLGYGIPGFLCGPVIGRMTDKYGRRWLIPIGLGISAVAVGILIFHPPLIIAALAVTFLSLGHDITQPALTGIVTDLNKERSVQAMSLNTFTLFIGFGVGSFLFGAVLNWSFQVAFLVFCTVQMLAAIIAVTLFRAEFHTISKPN